MREVDWLGWLTLALQLAAKRPGAEYLATVADVVSMAALVVSTVADVRRSRVTAESAGGLAVPSWPPLFAPSCYHVGRSKGGGSLSAASRVRARGKLADLCRRPRPSAGYPKANRAPRSLAWPFPSR